MAKIDQFIVPGDLDLDRVTLTIVPGSHFFLGAYTYQVSSRWENGKGVKIPEHTDVYNVLRRWLQRSYTIVKNSLFEFVSSSVKK
jgi:hypothetical protein